MDVRTYSFIGSEIDAMLNFTFADDDDNDDDFLLKYHQQHFTTKSRSVPRNLTNTSKTQVEPTTFNAAYSFPSPESTPNLCCFPLKSPMISGMGGDFDILGDDNDDDLAHLHPFSTPLIAPATQLERPMTSAAAPAPSATTYDAISELLHFNTHSEQDSRASMFFDDIAPPPQNASFQQHISIPQSLYQNLRVAAAVAAASASDHASFEPKVEMNLSEFQLLSAIACMSRPLPISTTTTSTTAAAPPTVVPSTTSLPTLNITLPTPSTPTSSNPPTSKRPRVSTVSDTSTPTFQLTPRRTRKSTSPPASPHSPPCSNLSETDWTRTMADRIIDVDLPNGEGRLYKCPFDGCDLSAKRRFNVQTHLRTHMPERARKHVCDECGRGYLRPYELERHCKRKRHGCKQE